MGVAPPASRTRSSGSAWPAAPPDVVIAMRRPTAVASAGRVRWFGLQYTLDVADLVEPSGVTRYDGIGLHSAWWRERTPDCLRLSAFNRAQATGTTPVHVDD